MSIRGVTYAVDDIPALCRTSKTLLLIHGFTGSRAVFEPFIGPLRETYRLIIPDMLGHDASDAPDDFNRYAMEETLLDMRRMLHELTVPRVRLFGYSMGGRIALAYAATFPDTVTKLVLEGASPGLADQRDRRKRTTADDALATSIVEGGIGSFVEHWEQIPLFAPQSRLPDDVWQRQRSIRSRQRANGLAASLQGIGTGRQPSYWHLLHKLQMPVLLMTGELDSKFTEINCEMAKRLPNARHVVIEGALHTPHLEYPDIFVDTVVTFLRDGDCRRRQEE